MTLLIGSACSIGERAPKISVASDSNSHLSSPFREHVLPYWPAINRSPTTSCRASQVICKPGEDVSVGLRRLWSYARPSLDGSNALNWPLPWQSLHSNRSEYIGWFTKNSIFWNQGCLKWKPSQKFLRKLIRYGLVFCQAIIMHISFRQEGTFILISQNLPWCLPESLANTSHKNIVH